jgi:type IV secretory pathway ATPase VirB11/archaellum biosynthesis ATPase
LEGFTVKKFLLVVFVGMVLAINIYGIVNKLMVDNEIEEVNHIAETTVTVYVE